MIQKPKGTYDLLGKKAIRMQYLERLIQTLMENYNYNYIRTPLFESSELFHRGVGETTDIVSKETYDFKDRGDRNMTLRPEGTAGVVRSFIENKMYGDSNFPVKLWYFGPMYRYERPQAGRFREFFQFGIEAFGSNDPALDAEIISISVNLIKLLGLKGIKVNINSLGDTESRLHYKEALLEYFKPHLDTLCSDCKSRYETNPLRILDCKVDMDKEIMKNVPKMKDYYNEESKEHFRKIQKYLEALGIEYIINEKLVRGLDYYTHTVFEVEANVKGFGSQNVLCGGGRYDHLVEKIGGPSTPGVGFAIGMERLMTALEFENLEPEEKYELDAYVIPVTEEQKPEALSLTNALRLSGFHVETDYMNRSMKGNFKASDRLGSKFILIIGEEEINTNVITVKNNKTKEEYKVPLEQIVYFLDMNGKTDECDCEHDHETDHECSGNCEHDDKHNCHCECKSE